MSEIFNPSTPQVNAPPPPPTLDDAVAKRQSSDAIRRRRGAAASLLTGPGGVESPTVGTKTLLGS